MNSRYPRDYFVPNFGKDADVLGTANSVSVAEKETGHKWNFPKANWTRPAWKDIAWDFNPALDDDVKVTARNL